MIGVRATPAGVAKVRATLTGVAGAHITPAGAQAQLRPASRATLSSRSR